MRCRSAAFESGTARAYKAVLKPVEGTILTVAKGGAKKAIAIADETEDQITHNIFYTAVTRARKHLTIYWSPEVCNRILARIRPVDYKQDFYLLKAKNEL